MSYKIEQIQDEDFEDIVPRMFSAFGNGYEFVNALYPSHSTPAGHKAIASRFRSMKTAAVNTHWIKVVDTVSAQSVGLALWTLIEEAKPPETALDGPPGTWPSQIEKEYCQAMHRSLVADRRKLIRENDLPIIILNILVVFSEHQQRGAGKVLLSWGVRMADEKRALSMVESTEVAQRLYETGGFVVERDYYLDAGERFADRPKDHILFMVRPRSIAC